jgi:hypothetical protein
VQVIVRIFFFFTATAGFFVAVTAGFAVVAVSVGRAVGAVGETLEEAPGTTG